MQKYGHFANPPGPPPWFMNAPCMMIQNTISRIFSESATLDSVAVLTDKCHGNFKVIGDGTLPSYS